MQGQFLTVRVTNPFDPRVVPHSNSNKSFGTNKCRETVAKTTRREAFRFSTVRKEYQYLTKLNIIILHQHSKFAFRSKIQNILFRSKIHFFYFLPIFKLRVKIEIFKFPAIN